MHHGGPATFLLTDIEGSTQLWEREGDRMIAVVARHIDIIGSAVAQRDGVRPVEQGEGDSTVIVFERPSDALAAAVDAQRALLAEDWGAGIELRVSMAIHTGDSRQRAPGLFVGRPLNRCARIRATASGRQIVVSSATADALGADLPDGVTLIDLGAHRLRDLALRNASGRSSRPICRPASHPSVRWTRSPTTCQCS